MAEHFLTNQKYLPIAARYEYCKGVSVLEAHRNFCKALGDNAMSYKDFDFWWFRFSKGNFDLDTQPPQTAEFTDIPHHIIENIIRKMDYAARCLFRKTSKKYRRAVDTIPFIIKELKFESLSQSTWLRINQLIIEFNRREEINHNDPNRILLCSRHYLKLAVRELIFIFRLRNVRVKKFSIYVNDGVIHENLDILKALAFKFRVETFKIGFEWDCYGEEDDPVDVQNEVMKVLPFLKPCALKSIEFYIYNKGLKLETDRIARTLQWKYARKLNVDGNVIVNTKSLKHFEKLTFLKDNLFTF
uniref:F-box domain-containing protein n=1 Tax=Caenorhabditis tropicalis TaxID=1561998 RepID=A0A1I7UPB1_9PELO